MAQKKIPRLYMHLRDSDGKKMVISKTARQIKFADIMNDSIHMTLQKENAKGERGIGKCNGRTTGKSEIDARAFAF